MAFNKKAVEKIEGYIPPDAKLPAGWTQKDRAAHNGRVLAKAMADSREVQRAAFATITKSQIRSWLPGGGKMTETAISEVERLLQTLAGKTENATRKPANHKDPFLNLESLGDNVPVQGHYMSTDPWLSGIDYPEDPGFPRTATVTNMPRASEFDDPQPGPQNLGDAIQFKITRSEAEHLYHSTDDENLKAAIAAKLGGKPEKVDFSVLHGSEKHKRILKTLRQADK